MLRRTCATHAQTHATVKDTQAQLRHADPTITLKFYQKQIPESVKNAFTAMESALFGGPRKVSGGVEDSEVLPLSCPTAKKGPL
jgi:hypothetical protein